MDYEPFDGAACAGSDLMARLLAELARAADSLALAEARIHCARAQGETPTDSRRSELRTCRRHVASLRRMLSGMPEFEGGGRAASA
jgi:hypothetical protein